MVLKTWSLITPSAAVSRRVLPSAFMPRWPTGDVTAPGPGSSKGSARDSWLQCAPQLYSTLLSSTEHALLFMLWTSQGSLLNLPSADASSADRSAGDSLLKVDMPSLCGANVCAHTDVDPEHCDYLLWLATMLQ